MSKTLDASHARPDDERRRRRAAFLKFGLAGVALLGIGAAATSAAWTDNAVFTASANAATVQLQGQDFASSPTYQNADTTSAAITLPPAFLQDLLPNQTRTQTVSLKNASSVPLNVTGVVAPTSTTGLFASGSTLTPSLSGVPTTLGVGATTTVTVTVTTGDLPSAFQGATGTYTVTFTGTTN